VKREGYVTSFGKRGGTFSLLGKKKKPSTAGGRIGLIKAGNPVVKG